MLRWTLHRQLDAEQKKVGESIDYLHHIADVSPGALMRLSAVMPFANSRKVLPKEAWFVGQIVALQHADCGTCVQIGVNLARKDGVSPELLRSVLAGDRDALPGDMLDVYTFAKAVVEGGDDDAVRETLRARYGERGLIESAYALAGSFIPPIVKRTLGYAKSCSTVTIDV